MSRGNHRAPPPEQYTVGATTIFIAACIIPKCNGTRILSRKRLEDMVLETGYNLLVNRSARSRRNLLTKAMNHLAVPWGNNAWIIK